MANPFSKGWKYMMSSFDAKIDGTHPVLRSSVVSV